MNITDRLSPNFTFGEMTKTNQSAFLDANRKEALQFLASGKALCEGLLEPIRAKFGPVTVNSAFRCSALNNAVGGSKSSQHMKFEAADFTCKNVTLQEIFDWVRKESGLKFGQVILEGSRPGKPTWIHISLGAPWRDPSRCGMALVYDGTRYVQAR